MSIPALILAGGLGTRLRHLVPDLPKPMADVAGKPFLYYILKHLQIQGIKDVYLSVGYKAEKIEEYFHSHFHSIKLHYIKEHEPLGTGGAMAYAIQHINAENILVINGDTFLNFDLNQLLLTHQNKLTVALKYVQQSNRYGFVETQNDCLSGFTEKSDVFRDGWINAGVYVMNKHFFLSHIPSHHIFSFEKDFLEKIFIHHSLKVFPVKKYFIDIGIPEDYKKAQKDFAQLKHLDINPQWTLFLDRDGVINKKPENDYVKKIEEFELLENVLEALALLKTKFGRIVVVTNQQGIGKGLMTEYDLEKIHQYFLSLANKEKTIIDNIYYAPELSSMNSIMRKPNIGMALKAKEDFPGINFSQSIMVGDSLSDIQFAHNVGIYSVLLSQQYVQFQQDFTFGSLYDFAKSITE